MTDPIALSEQQLLEEIANLRKHVRMLSDQLNIERYALNGMSNLLAQVMAARLTKGKADVINLIDEIIATKTTIRVAPTSKDRVH